MNNSNHQPGSSENSPPRLEHTQTLSNAPKPMSEVQGLPSDPFQHHLEHRPHPASMFQQHAPTQPIYELAANMHSSRPYRSVSNSEINPPNGYMPPPFYPYSNNLPPTFEQQQGIVTAPPALAIAVTTQQPQQQPSSPSLYPNTNTNFNQHPISISSNSNYLPSIASQIMAQYPSIPRTAFTLENPPTGIKPRVTTTLWEDEGTLCFQVEVDNVCVARREDNNMINGTKLLNIAGMSRGRRDGILKTEKVRRVIKVGAMHFKGVWIPYERALVLAGKENIVDLLYPLFVTDLKELLYHPSNYSRTALVMAAAERKRNEQNEQHQKQQILMQQEEQYQQHQQQPQLMPVQAGPSQYYPSQGPIN